jgi:hypothetical protein
MAVGDVNESNAREFILRYFEGYFERRLGAENQW